MSKKSPCGTIASAHLSMLPKTVLAIMAVLVPANGSAHQDAFADLIAAERGFAADAKRFGITTAFRTYVASDAILLRPEPAPAIELLAAERDKEGAELEWQPRVAAIARSNDLGFTMGPYHLKDRGKLLSGYFVTIWQRGPDGRWRWYLDHGSPPIALANPPALPTNVARLRNGASAKAIAASPRIEVAEDALNAAMVSEGAVAVGRRLADDGQLLRSGHAPVGAAFADTLLAREPAILRVERLGLRVSRAGDLAGSYGRISRGSDRGTAYYVRVWRLDAAGWRLLMDEVV